MNIKTITAAILLGITVVANANPRSKAQKIGIAVAYLPQASMSKGTAAQPSPEILDSDDQLSIIGYNGGNGFVVVANDDTFEPVLGYSDTQYTTSTTNPAFNWWKQAISKSLKSHLENGEGTVYAKPSGSHQGVTQLLTTEWGQGSPYYNLTPTYGTTHCVTGCVATAMAQIMNFHEWPDKGVGSSSWRVTTYDGNKQETGTKRETVVFSAATYDWADMLDKYTSGYTDAQAEAVATLMYHCGASVQMDYTPSGSSSYTFKAFDALRNNFKYNPYLKFYPREFMPVDEWMEIIYTQLDAHNPILYGGVSTSQGGHEFVLDGYDSDGRVHVNWGWNGSQDGYFDIASLNSFSESQDMCTIQKETSGAYASLFGFDGNLVCSQQGSYTINISAPTIYNVDANNFSGFIAVIAENVQDGDKTVIAETESFNIDGHGKENLYHGKNLTIGNLDFTDLPDGKYRLYMASKGASSFAVSGVSYPMTDTDWQPIRSNENYNNSYLFTKASGSITAFAAEQNANWTATPTGIGEVKGEELRVRKSNTNLYNIAGQRVDETYHGIVIQNGKKRVQK